MKLGITSVCLLGTISIYHFATPQIVTAQISSDGTLSTTVTSNDAINFLIENGDRAGDNLFHSFSEFSIPNLGEAYFNNATDIVNIFSRVTGGNISDIQGLIRANGTANLFLINPAGIIFGENASLDIGGSFFASTAESIVFGEGLEFSATQPEAAPLLTVNITPGLQFGNNPLPIEVSGANLAVNSGQNLSLLGGDVAIRNSEISAPGGQINLGGLKETGTIQIEELITTFPENITFSNLNLSDASIIDVTSTNNGSIAINAADFTMSGGSEILAGLTSGGNNNNAVSGNIIINATGNINLSEKSLIANTLLTNTVGNGGKIEVTADYLTLTGGSRIQTETNAMVSSGDINIQANSDINITGYADEKFFSGILTIPAIENTGDGGDINIATNNLLLTESGRISIETKGAGNAGNLNIQAAGDIEIISTNSDGLVSRFDGEVDRNATGNGGNIFIETNNLRLIDGGRISFETEGISNAGNLEIKARGDVEIRGANADGLVSRFNGEVNDTAIGNGGNISIEATNLRLIDGGRITFETEGEGNAGNVTIKATGDVEIIGAFNRFVSRLDGDVEGTATGNGGNISIEATNLRLINGGRISFETKTEGNAGNLDIKTTGDVEIRGAFENLVSRIDGDLEDTAMGNGGNISIEAANLRIIDGGRISFETEGAGNAGNLTIKATEDIEIRGIVDRLASRLDGGVEDDATGNGGNISIEAANLRLIDGGRIFFETEGAGNAGNLTIKVTEDIEIRGVLDGFISRLDGDVETDATGNGGNISIETNNLHIIDGGRISLETDGVGNAGNLEIQATGDVEIIGIDVDSELFSRIDADVDDTAIGNGGSVVIETNNLRIIDGGRITMETEGEGNAGNLVIKATGDVDIIGFHPLGQVSQIDAHVDSTATGNGGSVVVEATNLRLIDGGRISVETNGVGNAGNLEITTSESVAIIGNNSVQPDPSGLEAEVGTSGVGNGGDISIQTNSLLLSEGGRISANTDGMGRGGSVTINATDIELAGVSNDERSISRIEAASTTDAPAGSLNITTDNLTIRDRAQITVSGLSLGDAGNLNISANNILLDNQASLRAQVADGNQGNINLQIQDSLIAENNSQIIADVLGDGSGGNINLTTNNLQFNSGSTVSTNTTSTGDAGNINISGNNLAFDGELTGVFSEAVEISTGDAGNINLTTDLLSLTNNAQISTNSEGLGQAGNINIDAHRLEASQGNITATSLQTGGGNLFLTIDDLLLSNQSLISTSVLDSTGGGGNITINSEFIFARENSNIFANAVFGAGGNIQINTDTIFIAPDSAITASSRFGVDGVVTISNPDNDNNGALLELPKNTTDPSQQIAEGCAWVRNNSFIVTGRGGMVQNPTNNLGNDQMWLDIRDISENKSSVISNEEGILNREEVFLVVSDNSSVSQSPLMEANTWIINEQGNVELVAVVNPQDIQNHFLPANCAG